MNVFPYILLAVFCTALSATAREQASLRRGDASGTMMFRHSTTVEKERPQLDEETKRLAAAFRRDPSPENRAALRAKVAANYDAVIARKRAKLDELKRTAKHRSLVTEMEAIVEEVVDDREARIDAAMARFADPRFRPGLRDSGEAWLPVLGAPGRNVCIGRTPVTVAEWAAFAGTEVPGGRADYPVTGVSAAAAERYCAWLSAKDPDHVYRLPTEAEWELAAGHMPKDADFNCGVGTSTTPVEAYARTKGACGGVDFWGNCWEWTSTARGGGGRAVKGGAYDSQRTACRTEDRSAARDAPGRYPNVTFRVVREDSGASRTETEATGKRQGERHHPAGPRDGQRRGQRQRKTST